MRLKNFFGHLHTVNKHRWYVFKLSVRAGIPVRGLLHDLSKYSPTEFWEGVKYFDGKVSPIKICKRENGYSKAWLHHKGRNKHHFEYWLDLTTTDKTPIMPYKYAVEMVCDTLAASMVYNGKSWNPTIAREYFEKRTDKEYINPYIQDFLLQVYRQVESDGLKKTVNKKNLKNLYDKCVLQKNYK